MPSPVAGSPTHPSSFSSSPGAASTAHVSSISEAPSISSFVSLQDKRASVASSSRHSHLNSPPSFPQIDLPRCTDSLHCVPSYGQSSPINIPLKPGMRPSQFGPSPVHDASSCFGTHYGVLAQDSPHSPHSSSSLRGSDSSGYAQTHSTFSPLSTSLGHYPSYYAYGQSPRVYYSEQSSPLTSSPSTRVDQRRSSSIVSTSPHASPASQAEFFARSSPPTPPMVILNTVNNFFSATTPPGPHPQIGEAWGERRQSKIYHNPVPSDQDYHDGVTLGTHHPASSLPQYDSRSWHDSYHLQREECGQQYYTGSGPDSEFTRSFSQPRSPVSYVPSSTTMPSFGSVLQMNNDSDTGRAGRLREDKGANDFGPAGENLQVPDEEASYVGRQRSTRGVTRAPSASSFKSCASCPTLHPSAHVALDKVVGPIKDIPALGHQCSASTPYTPPQVAVPLPQVSQTLVQSRSQSHSSAVSPLSSSCIPQQIPHGKLCFSQDYPYHRPILAAGGLGHSSVTDNPVSSTTQTMSGQPLYASPAPGTSLIREQTLSSTLSSLSHTSLKGVCENPRKERFSRVFSRGVGRDDDKEEQDREKTAKSVERREARKKFNSVSCGGAVDTRETTLVSPSQDRQGFLGRLFHRECVEKQEKTRVREDIVEVLISTIPPGKIEMALETVGETARDVILPMIRQCLEVSAEVMEIVPVPGLAEAVRLLLDIWDACEQVGENQLLCLRLTRRCTAMVFCIHREIVEAGEAVEQELSQPLKQLCHTLKQVCKFLHGLTDKSILTRFFARRKFKQDIKACEDEISDTLARFNISTHVRILKWELSGKWEKGPCNDAKACSSYAVKHDLSPSPSTGCIQCRMSRSHNPEEDRTHEPMSQPLARGEDQQENLENSPISYPLNQILEIWAAESAEAEALDRASARVHLQDILSIRDESELRSRLEVSPEELPETVAALKQELREMETVEHPAR